MIRITLIYIFSLCYSYNVNAQPYIEGGKTRHRFAQLNIGLDYQYFFGPTNSFKLNSNEQPEEFKLPNQSKTRFIIGGTHFWGHSDFYIAIPLVSFGGSGFSSGVETGAKYFPWKIENNKIRPYIGASWLPINYKQENGAKIVQSKLPVMTGIVINSKKNLFEIGFGYNYNNTLNYYISPVYQTTVKTNPYWLSFSYKIMIESTLSAEKDWQSGKTKIITDTLSKLNRLNGLSLGVGISSSFFTKKSSHLSEIAPYAGNHKTSDIFPEFGLGYYFHNNDMQINFAYRNISSEINAYNFNQKTNSKSLTLEAFKFIFDFHGFVPFAGISISKEWFNVIEKNQNLKNSSSKNGIYPGFTFGWDIRPNRIQTWYLRTNLRYFPMLNIEMNSGKNHPFDRLEFNFIQLIILPERFIKF